MSRSFICRRCGRSHSFKEYAESMFCRNCGTFLRSQNRNLEKTRNETELGERKISILGRKGRLTYNPDKAKRVAVILFEQFNSEKGVFGHNVMPEDSLPVWGSFPMTSGVRRGSYEHVMFITMVVSIDYQRDADQLWDAGRRTFGDGLTRWLFYPDRVVERGFDETVRAMRIHKLSKKPQKDAEIWFRVSESLFEIYHSNPLNLIRECDYDALKIYRNKFNLTFKHRFPYLSGNKIFPLWIRMLHDNVGIELVNIEHIPIPVDVHVARATFTTGCLIGEYVGTISDASPRVDEAWRKTVEAIKHNALKYRLQLDEPLWHLSRYGCRFRRGNFCPKSARCPVSASCVNGVVNVSAEEVEVDTSD